MRRLSLDKESRTTWPSTRFTVFTGPDATKKSVISRIAEQVYASRPGREERAAVVLVSPRHASWLDDKSFMADLVASLEGASDVGPKFHLVAAVVSGLSPRAPSRELQEGFSIQVGSRNGLVPDLWARTSPEVDPPSLPQRADSEPSSALSILLPRQITSKEARITLTLPLANTLFQNGRRSTLLVSEWRQAKGPGPHKSLFELVRMAEKRSQVIDLPASVVADKVNIRAPLVPITYPRKVLEGLGNILAKIEISGVSSPASKELQTNIPRLLETRGVLSRSEAAAGRLGVWAVVYPKHMFRGDENLVRFYKSIDGRFLGTALNKLVFDMSTDPERVAWEIQPVLRNALFHGARLHRILSGGGEWGTKSTLLSLDPQTSHGRESEEDELNKFIKSFQRDDDAKDAMAKPGDYVQFFVERDPVQLTSEKKSNLAIQTTDFPPVSFGVGDTNLKDIDQPDTSVDSPIQTRGRNWIVFNHFGGYSAEGIYLPILATIGILSIGDMGMGIAKLLIAKGFSVATNCSGRSKETRERVKEAQVTDLGSDAALVRECDVVLSIVPPRDAAATAQRVIDAMQLVTKAKPPLYFADLNAVAPSTVKAIARTIEQARVPITLIDGSVLGGPPHPAGGASTSGSPTAAVLGDWNVPSVPTSGPVGIADIPGYGAGLAGALNVKHIGPEVGASSGLKMCFASLSKGYSAVAVQSFTTAERLGVLGPLREAMEEIIPSRVKQTENALVGMPPKAYRWVGEMEEIARTHAEEGGFEDTLFRGAAGVFKAVAEDTVLGEEKVGQRKRGRTAEDVAAAMAEGLEKKRKKMD
ncbi:hypothetical protein VMCG_06256 [Cytospora schulzeri]|uniref:Phosphogluconate dehydrogenase NAD-binding putative C-terminal domain-containing protein n=1 Tax=Cytospora schulzeri TaxID=448051 RepID=A0A423W9E3_9PEZI|nr:hypothetical protein VMCG_06256 [Valsa malicola]